MKDRQELVQHMEIRSDNPDLVIENIADYISARENHYCKCEAKNISKILQNVYLKLPAIDPSKCVIRLADMINANERAKRTC